MLWWILIGIAMFMFLVFIHELGHFMAAKKAGVKVLEFGIGIPPKAMTLFTDKSGTEYTLNWIPLGGFVRLKGENPQGGDFLDKDSFVSASLPWKLIILAAGIIMNLIFAWIVFTISFTTGIKPIAVVPENMIPGNATSYLMATPQFLEKQGYLSGEVSEIPLQVSFVQTWSLAEQNWILSGDVFLSIDDQEVTNKNFSTISKSYINKSFTLIGQRNQEEYTKQITCPEDNCFFGIGIVPGEWDIEVLPIKMWLWKAMKAGVHEIWANTTLTMGMLKNLGKNLFSFNKEKMKWSVEKLSGPVGIVYVGTSILSAWGRGKYLAFGALISLALAIFNVLPIPALDGGRAVWVLIQHIFGLKPEKYYMLEWYVNFFFFIVLMIFGVYIIFQDLNNIPGINIPFF